MVTWAPTLVDVAGCIPSRTLDTTAPGSDAYLGTFTANTEPTSTAAQNKIDKAVADVLLRAGTVNSALEDVAKNAAMWRAAADIELSYPDRNADVQVYEQLNARALYEWGLFEEAVNNQGTGLEAQVPQWYTPKPPWWADRTDI